MGTPRETVIEEENVKIQKIRLYETPVIFHFELKPDGYVTGTKAGEKVEAANREFLQKREKKRESYQRMEDSAQTESSHSFEQFVQTEPLETKEEETIASDSNIYDAFNVEDGQDSNDKDEDDLGTRLKKAALITSRVLASNRSAKEQITFIKKGEPSCELSYRTEELWSFVGAGKVNKICLNPKDENSLAVGYGGAEGTGSCLFWHVKNTETPETRFETDGGVTDMEFSGSKPWLLALVTDTGALMVADLSREPPNVTRVSERDPFGEPLWGLSWCALVEPGDWVLTVGQSGELQAWDVEERRKVELARLTLLATRDSRGKLLISDKSPPTDYLFEAPYIGLSVTPSPLSPFQVLVTTDVGAVLQVDLKKSTVKDCLDWKRTPYGHQKSVEGLAHSPFSREVFLTYSADGTVKIWRHGTPKHLCSLRSSVGERITAAGWSPSHSTILASLSSSRACLWDLAVRADRPVAEIISSSLTTLAFSRRGTALLVGTATGCLQIHRLHALPPQPCLQQEHLHSALSLQ